MQVAIPENRHEIKGGMLRMLLYVVDILKVLWHRVNILDSFLETAVKSDAKMTKALAENLGA